MFSAAADLMNPNTFSPYTFPHQPGTSTAAMAASAAAVTQNSFLSNAALSFEAASVAANTLMHGAMRTPNSYRPEIPRGNKRERTKFDAFQLEQMERFFHEKPYPDGNDREEMAKRLNLTDVKVQIWFKNRRAKDRNQKHLDDLMAKSRGDFVAQKSFAATSGRSGETPMKKKRRIESPLPDPMQQQQQQQQQNLLQQQQQQLQQSSHESKDINNHINGEIKQEVTDSSIASGVVDYNNGIFDASTWDEQKDIKSFYQNGNYAAFGFPDPTATFQATNTNWMTQSYPSYHPFNYFPPSSACYYTPNGVTPQTAAAAYNDFYANAATHYASIPNLKDSTKIDLPSTASPNNNNTNNNNVISSPTTMFKPHGIEQQYG